MTSNEDNTYKSNADDSWFRKELRTDVEMNLAKFNDPVVLGEIMYKLLEERENTNRILKNILAKLENMDKGTGVLETSPNKIILSDIDEEIFTFVKTNGKVTAEDVKKHFQYKGKNAASARLNRLYELNLLNKQQVGKKVVFFPL